MTVQCSLGHENPDGSAFCDECGEPLSGAAPVAVAAPQPAQSIASAPVGSEVCPSCGSLNPAGESFCSNCGAMLGTTVARSAVDPWGRTSQQQTPGWGQNPPQQQRVESTPPSTHLYQPTLSIFISHSARDDDF